MAERAANQQPSIAPGAMGPWPRGMVNTISDHALPMDALLDAVDCDIDREGYVFSRPGYTLLDDSSSYEYLHEHQGIQYAVAQGSVGIVGETAFTTLRPAEGPVGWGVVSGALIFCDNTGVYRVEGQTANKFVVRPTLEEEDRYGLVDMPGGRAVAYWRGRLLVLRGRSLLWSEALDFGCHSPARNFIRFPTTPTWMAPLPTGIFVGLRDSVVFLAGTDPAQFTMAQVAGRSCPGASLVTTTEHLPPDLQTSGLVAVWFSDVGFVVGRPDGGVIYPQAGNLRGLPIVPRTLALIDDRIYAFANEE